MGINRPYFLESARLRLFDGRMRSDQIVGITAILDKWEREMPEADDRWLAYMLATAHHETGRTMQPVRETFAATDSEAISRLNRAYRANKLPWVKTPYWTVTDGHSWLGRGYVQLTHKENYVRMAKVLKIGIDNQPNLAMKIDIALEILFRGMIEGLFTKHKLSDYFNKSRDDWRNARRIINWTERADLVASYGKSYYGCISYTTGPV